MKCAVMALVLLCPLVAADQAGEQTRKVLIGDAKAITAAAAREITSRDTWEPVREQRRDQMRDMLGLLPWPVRTPLHARVAGKLVRDGYTVENISFESRPRIYVSANLYLPRHRQGKVPVVLYVCGHSYSPYGAKAQYQRHGISLAKNGYAALILDPIQIAETFALHHGVYNQAMPEWYARGYSPASVEVWNAIRAIDYLETRPEVDISRLGMTGRSGGAAMTWFTAAVDERVKVAVPIMGISTYAADLVADTQQFHCDCMFLVNSLRHGMLHQGALIAPRPLLMAHGRRDVLFPVPGYQEFERRIGALYASYGQKDAFRNVVVDTKHKDSDFLRETAIRWFDRYLMRVENRPLDLSYQNEPGEHLLAFPAGPPEDAENYRVDETFFPTAKFASYRRLDAWKKHRTTLLGLLRAKVFGGFPKQPPPLAVRITQRPGDDYFQDVRFQSEPDLEVPALLHVPGNAAEPAPALLYVAENGDDAPGLRRLFRQPRPGSPVVRMAVFPRGIGERPWPRSLRLDLFRNAMLTGRTLDSMRLWDVLRAVAVLRATKSVDASRITVAGDGLSAVLALYAAILDTGIHQVLLASPTLSHTEGPYFLNVLRYTDIPEAAALLAPRRLNFYPRMPAAFQPVRAVYRLYGEAGHLFVTRDRLNVIEGRYDHNFASGL